MREVKTVSRVYPDDGPLFLVVDLFCGFGGTSTGYDEAEINGQKIVKVIAAVNHDKNAIKSHWLNHPDVKHFEEDIRTLDLTELTALVNYYRKRYPNAKLILWASLECTNYSKVKGGQARDADSRTLANHLFRYQKALNPDYIKIENVVEFMSWGPMRIKTKKAHKDRTDLVIIKDRKTGEPIYGWQPIKKRNGEDFVKWSNKMCSLGYYQDWKEMNSADYGAFTSRNRLFGCFAKPGLPITWPPPTHSKHPDKGMFSDLQKWNPVKQVLDFTNIGTSILNKDKKFSKKTYERIYAGMQRHKNKFISSYYGNGHNSTSINSPSPTLKTKDSATLITLIGIIENPSHGGNCTSTDQPCPVIVARQDKAPLYLLQCETGDLQIAIYDTDTEIEVKIKKFMMTHKLRDVKRRMLLIPEMLRIQGFPDNYKMVGTKTNHKKFIGNSVHTLIPKFWAETMGRKIIDGQNAKAA